MRFWPAVAWLLLFWLVSRMGFSTGSFEAVQQPIWTWSSLRSGAALPEGSGNGMRCCLPVDTARPVHLQKSSPYPTK
jgi:hypothetical protein